MGFNPNGWRVIVSDRPAWNLIVEAAAAADALDQQADTLERAWTQALDTQIKIKRAMRERGFDV